MQINVYNEQAPLSPGVLGFPKHLGIKQISTRITKDIANISI